MLLLFAAFLFSAKFADDPGMMFPPGSRSAAIYSAVRDVGLYSSFTVEFDTREADGVSKHRKRISDFASRVASLPGVEKVEFEVPGAAGEVFSELPSAFVQLFGPEMLERIDPERASTSALTALAMGAPASPVRSDPGNFRGLLTSSLLSWRKNSPFRFSVADGIMCDETGRYALLRVKVDPAAVTGAAAIERLYGEIVRPRPGVSVRAVSPLLHAMENENLSRRDLSRVGIFSAAALMLVFLVLYRGDWRALWIPVMPMVAAALSVVVCAAVFERVNLMVVGIGGGIAGFAVDQGIHVYSAFRGSGMPAVRRLTKMLLVALATSIVAFAAVTACGVPLFVQLGTFASVMLSVNFLLSRFLLPRLLGSGIRIPKLNLREPSRTVAFSVTAFAAAACAFSLAALPNIRADFSLSALDGASAATKETERLFVERWANPGGGSSVAVTAESEDALLSALAGCERWTPAALVPPSERRRRNVEAWRSAAAAERLRKLKADLAAGCADKGLPPDFFAPFFESVEKGIASADGNGRHPVVDGILSFALGSSRGGWSALLFAPEKDARVLAGRIAGAFEITPRAVEAAAVESYRPGLIRSAALCLAAQLFLVAFVYRRIRKFALVFLPAAVAALCGLGVSAVAGFAVDMTVCLAGVLVFGLAVDYGVFALCRSEDGDRNGEVARAMILSAVTTVAAAAALSAASHPALSRLGIVILTGILFTALAALFLVPSLRRLRPLSAAFAAAFLCGCVSSGGGDGGETVSRQSPGEVRLWNVTANALWYSVPMIVAVKVDPATRSVHAVGTSPSGVTLFESEGEGGVERRGFVSPLIPEIGAKMLFGDIQEDLSRVFFAPRGSEGERTVSRGLWPFWGWTLELDGVSRDGRTFDTAVYEKRASLCGFIFKEVSGNGE